MKTSNPIFNRDLDAQVIGGEPMTVSGTMNKTLLLLVCAFIPAAVVWYQALLGYTDKVMMIMTIGLIVGLISAFVIIFKNNTAPYLAPVYAFAEGALLGGLSVMVDMQFPGIAIQAVVFTFIVLFAMLGLYKFKLIRATEKFRSTIIAATFSIMLVYLVTLVASFFNINIPFVFGGGVVGIVFSAIVVILAALNLILDFDFIEQSAYNMLPKHYEWYGAFGLMVTLVWLYMEILRLLSKLRSNE